MYADEYDGDNDGGDDINQDAAPMMGLDHPRLKRFKSDDSKSNCFRPYWKDFGSVWMLANQHNLD